MAVFSRISTTFSIVFFFAALFQILIGGGIIYGWATIRNVFKHERFYDYLCANENEIAHGKNSNFSLGKESLVSNFTSAVFSECGSQRERFSLIFTVSVFSVTCLSVPIGIYLDKYGPKSALILGCIINALAGIGLTQVTRGTEDLLFPVFIMFSIGGQIQVLSLYKTGSMIFGKLKSLAISALNGAFDSSAVILVIFKVLYSSGFNLQHISIFYASLSFTVAVLVIIFLVPSNKQLLEKITENKESLLPVSDVGSRLADYDAANLDNQTQQQTFKDLRLTVLLDSDEKDDAKALKSDESDDEQRIEHKKNDKISTTANTFPATVKSSVFSTIYIMQFIFLCIIQLRLWFYIGSLNSYLKVVLAGDENLVGNYLVIFGYIQLSGLLVSIVTGLIFDRNLICGQKDKLDHSSRQERLRSSITVFLLTILFSLLLSIITVTNSVQALIPGFIILAIVRGGLYAGVAAFVSMAFKPQFFGTLFGLIMFTAACFGLLQYVCYVIIEAYFKGDPYWVNVVMLIMNFLASAHPLYLWHYTRVKKTRKE